MSEPKVYTGVVFGDLTAEERFWKKVNVIGSHECWEWLGKRDTYGYGRLKVNGRYKGAHIVSYAISNGPVSAGLFVLHSCDNPGCVNPYHLRVGTQTENMKDRLLRNPNSWLKGSANGGAKLTENDIRRIRKMRAEGGYTQASLAAKFEVTKSTIGDILTGKTWRHVGA